MKIKPCPFCGSSQLSFFEYMCGLEVGIECKCGASMKTGNGDKQGAIDRWNSRVGEPEGGAK